MRKMLLIFITVLFTLTLSAERKDYGFISYDFEGNFFQLKNFIANTKSDYVVIDFFSINCEPCKKSLSKWEDKYKELKGKKIEVILLVVPSEKQNAKAEKPIVKNFLKKQNLTFKSLYDMSFYVAKLFKVAEAEKDSMTVSVPQIFILDSKMQIVSSSDNFEEALKQIDKLENRESK